MAKISETKYKQHNSLLNTTKKANEWENLTISWGELMFSDNIQVKSKH